MVHWSMITRRMFRRVRYVFTLSGLLTWEYESCKRCGHCFHICWTVKNELWEAVTGAKDGGGGSLCIDCFVELAQVTKIRLDPEDIHMELFTP